MIFRWFCYSASHCTPNRHSWKNKTEDSSFVLALSGGLLLRSTPLFTSPISNLRIPAADRSLLYRGSALPYDVMQCYYPWSQGRFICDGRSSLSTDHFQGECDNNRGIDGSCGSQRHSFAREPHPTRDVPQSEGWNRWLLVNRLGKNCR